MQIRAVEGTKIIHNDTDIETVVGPTCCPKRPPPKRQRICRSPQPRWSRRGIALSPNLWLLPNDGPRLLASASPDGKPCSVRWVSGLMS